jgi:hypothetical protein
MVKKCPVRIPKPILKHFVVVVYSCSEITFSGFQDLKIQNEQTARTNTIRLLTAVSYEFHNELECLLLVSLSMLCRQSQEPNPRVEHLKGVSVG